MVAGETLIVPVRAKVGDLASIYSFNGTGSSDLEIAGVAENRGGAGDGSGRRNMKSRSAQAEHDVTDFVGEMKAVGLVEVPAAVAMAGDSKSKDQWGGKDCKAAGAMARNIRVRCFQTWRGIWSS